MPPCRYCGRTDRIISARGYCAACLRGHFDEVWPEVEALHHESRKAFNLPVRAPSGSSGGSQVVPMGRRGHCPLTRGGPRRASWR